MLNSIKSSVVFECTSMFGMNPNGTIKPDEHGYRPVVLGALNVMSRKGEYYTLEGAERLFQDSSIFQRKVQAQALRGEDGHPIQAPGQSDTDFAFRIRRVEEGRICVHHRKVWLDFDNVRDARGDRIIAIMGESAPSGALAHVLERSFNNPYENVAFSVRCFSNLRRDSRGILHRSMREIVTFDRVSEQGITEADKYFSPNYSAEGYDRNQDGQLQPGISQGVVSLMEREYSKSFLLGAFNERHTHRHSQESGALLTADELFTSLGWGTVDTDRPFLNW